MPEKTKGATEQKEMTVMTVMAEYDKLFDIAQVTILRGADFGRSASDGGFFGDEIVPGATVAFHNDGTPSCVTLWGLKKHFGDAPPRASLRRRVPGVPWTVVFGLFDAGTRYAKFCLSEELSEETAEKKKEED